MGPLQVEKEGKERDEREKEIGCREQLDEGTRGISRGVGWSAGRSVGRTYRRVHAPRRGRPRQAGVTECADLLFYIRAPRAQQPFRTSWGSERSMKEHEAGKGERIECGGR